MSVPLYKRGKSKFELANRADEIAAFTLEMCSKEKVFPKRYRWCITARLVDAMFEMCENIKMANSITVKDASDFALRKTYQTKALAVTNSIFNIMDIAYRRFPIEDHTISYWTTKMQDVQNLIRSWRDSDIKRYADVV